MAAANIVEEIERVAEAVARSVAVPPIIQEATAGFSNEVEAQLIHAIESISNLVIDPPADLQSSKSQQFARLEAGIFKVISELTAATDPISPPDTDFETSTQALVGREFDENLHSDFIATLLSSERTGDLASRFLEKLVGQTGQQIERPNGHQFSYRETRLDELDNRHSGTPLGGRRLDVLIRTGQLIVVVETKVWTGESESQTEDYARVVRTRYPEPWTVHCIFLSPYGKRAESRQFASISFAQLFLALQGALSETACSAQTSRIAREYMSCLLEIFIRPKYEVLRRSKQRLKERGYEFA